MVYSVFYIAIIQYHIIKNASLMKRKELWRRGTGFSRGIRICDPHSGVTFITKI